MQIDLLHLVYRHLRRSIHLLFIMFFSCAGRDETRTDLKNRMLNRHLETGCQGNVKLLREQDRPDRASRRVTWGDSQVWSLGSPEPSLTSGRDFVPCGHESEVVEQCEQYFR